MSKPQSKELERGKELMRTYTQSLQNRNELLGKIKNELDAYDKNMKEAAVELKQIGEANRSLFNDKDRLEFETGYLLISHSAVVKTHRNFELSSFHAARPDLVDIELKSGSIKKLFLDEDARKELKALGVSIDDETSIKIIPNKE